MFSHLSMSLSEFSTLDVLPGLSHAVLLRRPGEDGGAAQCSGMARHSLHLVHCGGENQRGERADREFSPLFLLSPL